MRAMRPRLGLSFIAAGLLAASSAGATSYNFDVLYSGNDSAALATGSDDPTATTLNAGDSFVYSLTAQNGGFWSTIAAGDVFPLFAFNVAEAADRRSDSTFELLDKGVVVFSDFEIGANNQQVHLGTNTENLPAGLVFDEFYLQDSLISAFQPNSDNTGYTQTPATSSPRSALPYAVPQAEAPEVYSPSIIAYSVSAAPEPTTWSLLGFGVGIVGLAMRATRRRCPSALPRV